MARVYRRKRGKRLVGNFRQPLPGGGDHNLMTKDATEAERRGRAVVQAHRAGKRGAELDAAWGPVAAAAVSAADADPARHDEAAAAHAKGSAPSSPPAQPQPSLQNAAAAAPPLPSAVAAAPALDPEDEAAESMDDAAAAAAAEVVDDPDAVDAAPAPARDAKERAKSELDKAMAELSEGDESLLDSLADGAAAGVLYAEGWAIARGINWKLRRSGSTARVQHTPGDEKAIARKFLRLGLKVKALEWFPWLVEGLTPGWAIVAGLAFGAKDAVISLAELPAEGAPPAAHQNGVRPAAPAPAPAPPTPPAPAPDLSVVT
jgi:hypothetical protein